MFKVIKKIFDEFKPEVIVSPNFASLPHLLFFYFCRKTGVGMMAVASSVVKGYYILADGRNYEHGSFYDHLEKLNRGEADSPNRGKAKDYMKDFREKLIQQDSAWRFEKPLSFKQKIRHAGAPYYHILRWCLGKAEKSNYLKTIGATVDYKPPYYILRDYYSHERNKRLMKKFSYYSLDKVNKFVYFPLQYQPEEIIDTQALFFSNQLETARLVAMSLPDDYTLVVKEHPAMLGLRPASYLEKLSRTPNVKLIDYRISNESILKIADLVIGSGTSLAEAAFYNKPAIQLGDYGPTIKLPNVFQHSDLTTLHEKIKQVMQVDLRSNEYENKLENYVSAIFDQGVNINYSAVWERGEEQEKMDDFWRWYKRGIERLLK